MGITDDRATSLKTTWTVAAKGADLSVESLVGDYWTTTDMFGINWLYFSSSYAGAIPVSALTAAKDTAKFYQWISLSAPGLTVPKYELIQCSTTFKGTEGEAKIAVLDNTFGVGWNTNTPANPLTSQMLSGVTLLVRDTDHSTQTWNGSAIPAAAAVGTTPATVAKGAFTNDCAVRRPWTNPTTFSIKTGDTMKFKAGAYTMATATSSASALVGGVKDFDCLVAEPIKKDAMTITAAMVSAVALTLLM